MLSEYKLSFEVASFAYDPRKKWDLVLVPNLLKTDVT